MRAVGVTIVVAISACAGGTSRDSTASADPLTTVRSFAPFATLGRATAAARALDVTLPTTSRGELRLATSDGFELSIAADDRASLGAKEDAAVIFRHVAPSTDRVVGLDGEGVEDVRLLRDATAPLGSAYVITLGTKLVDLRARDGRVEAIDAQGRARIATAPIFAIDAGGQRRSLSITVAGTGAVRSLTLSLDATGLRYPIAVDPAWRATKGTMNVARCQHAAVPLPNGTVLVVGGARLDAKGEAEALSLAETWSPTTDTWTVTGSLRGARALAAAALTPTGVLITGGRQTPDAATYTSTAELFRVAASAWEVAAPMKAARCCHTATALGSTEKVLVAGGFAGLGDYLPTAELWDGSKWVDAGTVPGDATAYHQAVYLPVIDKVLIVGGKAGTKTSARAALYSATSGFQRVASMSAAREHFSATLLASGKVLVAGGSFAAVAPNPAGTLSAAEIYDPATDKWSAAASMPAPRHHHQAALLPNGNVMVTGGNPTGPIASRDVLTYDPNTDAWTKLPDLATGRWWHTATPVGNGRVLVAGGAAGFPSPTPIFSDAELFGTANGEQCTAAGACVSGACVKGVCCDTPCDGAGLECSSGRCLPVPKPTCTSDAKGVVGPTGVTPCTQFLCRDGACLRECASTDECQAGLVCDGVSKQCTAARGNDDESGCRVGTSRQGPSSRLLIVAGVAAAALRRRRARGRDKT